MSLNKNTVFCVYRHLKPCGEVFYIGIADNFKRPYNKISRNKHWKNKIIKYPNYEVQILTTGLTKEEACELEISLIAWYGRYDLGLGKLVNKTNGGESTHGRIMEQWQRDQPQHIPELLKYVNSVCGMIKYKDCVLTHCPIHESEISRFNKNIHGHVHEESLPDGRYINVSCEVVDYTPKLLEELI